MRLIHQEVQSRLSHHIQVERSFFFHKLPNFDLVTINHRV